jgi:AraC-like DNA-binding protein
LKFETLLKPTSKQISVTGRSPAIRRCAHIDTHLDHDLREADLAALCGRSASAFSRLFRQQRPARMVGQAVEQLQEHREAPHARRGDQLGHQISATEPGEVVPERGLVLQFTRERIAAAARGFPELAGLETMNVPLVWVTRCSSHSGWKCQRTVRYG